MRSKVSTRTRNAVINYLVLECNCKWIKFDSNGEYRTNPWELVTPEHIRIVLQQGIAAIHMFGEKGKAELEHVLETEEKQPASGQGMYYTLTLPVDFDPALFQRLTFLKTSQRVYYFNDKDVYYKVVDYLLNQGVALKIAKTDDAPDVPAIDVIRKGTRIFRTKKVGMRRTTTSKEY